MRPGEENGNSVHTPSTGVIPILWMLTVDNSVERLGKTRGQAVENSGRTSGSAQEPPALPGHRTAPVYKKKALACGDSVLHRLHRTYYYDFPIYLEKQKSSSRCPAAAGLNTACGMRQPAAEDPTSPGYGGRPPGRACRPAL